MSLDNDNFDGLYYMKKFVNKIKSLCNFKNDFIVNKK